MEQPLPQIMARVTRARARATAAAAAAPLLGLPEDLELYVARLTLADHLPAALRLSQTCTALRSRLAVLLPDAAARRLRWVPSLSGGMTVRDRSLVARPARDDIAWAAGELLPTTGTSTWTMKVDNSGWHSACGVRIGVSDADARHAWGLRLYSGTLYRFVRAAGQQQRREEPREEDGLLLPPGALSCAREAYACDTHDAEDDGAVLALSERLPLMRRLPVAVRIYGSAHAGEGMASGTPGAMLEPGVPPHLSGLMAPPPLEGADAAGAEAAALGYGSHGRPPALSNPEMVAFYRMQEADERRTKRLARNRTSARLRRMRKKTMVRDATRPARPRAPARAGAAARE